MTYVITDECVKCKYTDCVEYCPIVGCFHEGEFMLVINPDKCIDCGVCVDVCPPRAIQEESPELMKWLEIGKNLSKKWPPITSKKPPPPDADNYLTEKGKFEKYKGDTDLLN